jgi:methylated-DNA-[protein]-cysteine S-methyltransferase
LGLEINQLSLKSRIGEIWLGCTPRGLFWVNLRPVDTRALEGFFDDARRVNLRQGGEMVELAARELVLYLEGKLKKFTAKMDLRGTTPFQRKVWRATCKVPYGQVRTYAWIADRLGDPNSARAVGNALGKNPIPIFIPCHRVVGAHGGLGGFSAGLSFKRWLLSLESGQSSLGLGADGDLSA